MILTKTLSGLTLCSLVLSLLVWFFTVPATLSAQTADVMSCQLNGLPTAALISAEDIPEIDALRVSVDVTNASTYRFEGVSVAVALYDDADADVPLYWTMLSQEFSLPAQSTLGVEASLDTTNIPAGDYLVKVFASQGDFDNLLTVALRDGVTTEGISVTKTNAQKSAIDVALSINGQSADAQTLSFPNREQLAFNIETTNTNARAFVGSTLEVVVTEGEIPAGTAVSERYSDSVKLIPGSTRRSNFIDATTLGGRYTAYSILQQANVLHKLQTTVIQLGDEAGDSVFRYLSGVGLSAAADGAVAVVGCVETIGDESGLAQFEVVSLTTSTGGEVVFDSAMLGKTAMFTVTEGEAFRGVEVDLNASYSTTPPPSDVSEGEVNSTEMLEFVKVDGIGVQLNCDSGDCELRQVSISDGYVTDGNSSQRNSFYYYAGIVIAAALLGYIMIRRLHPDSSQVKTVEETDPGTELK